VTKKKLLPQYGFVARFVAQCILKRSQTALTYFVGEIISTGTQNNTHWLAYNPQILT